MFSPSAMKYLVRILLSSILAFSVTTGALRADQPAPGVDLQSVTAVVEQGMTALYLTGDEPAVEGALHEGYALMLVENGRLVSFSRQLILTGIREAKQAGKFPTFPGASFAIDAVEVVGDSAMARVRFFQDGVHTCSDHILLYRFPDGWKWVALTSHHHAPLRRS